MGDASLSVKDSLTGTVISIPIDTKHATVPAAAFAQLKFLPSNPQILSPSTASKPNANANANANSESTDADASVSTVPLRLYDPGLKNTVVCKSKISDLDPVHGKFYYRGYDVEELVGKSSFMEVAYLLIYGNLPNKAEQEAWNTAIMTHTYLHTGIEKQMETFRYDAHPMGMFIATVASLSTFHPEANPALAGANLYMSSSSGDYKEMRNKQIFRILGKTPSIAAATYRNRIGRPFNRPKKTLDYCENFCFMLDRLNESDDWSPDAKLVEIFEKLFIIGCDSGSACSTITMRHLISSGVDPYTAVAGSCGALFGERKSAAVTEMLEHIEKAENIASFLTAIKRRDEGPVIMTKKKRVLPKKLMGFGHRIFNTGVLDPRVKLLQDLAAELSETLGSHPLYNLALSLQESVAQDPYFVNRNIHQPNVDYWSAVIYSMLGFPTDMFPVLTAIPRIVGFLAHWVESLDDPEYKIFRPRQIYTGKNYRTMEDAVANASTTNDATPNLDQANDESIERPQSSLEEKVVVDLNPTVETSDPLAARRRDVGDTHTIEYLEELVRRTQETLVELKSSATSRRQGGGSSGGVLKSDSTANLSTASERSQKGFFGSVKKFFDWGYGDENTQNVNGNGNGN